ncbi:MAG: sugar phosphate isomerase/epimerase family protein [archaeon]
MKTTFSKGLFLHIKTQDMTTWKKDIDEIKSFQNVDHVEIWTEKINLSDEEINWLKKELYDYNIIIHAPFINLSLISLHNDINQATILILKKTIDLAYKLKAGLITVHAGAYPLFFNEDEVRTRLIKNFKEIINYSKDKVPVTIENISMKKSTQISYPVFLTELKRLKQEIPEINFTLDVGHCVQNDDIFFSFLSENCESIKNIHLHNASKFGSAHYGFNKKGDLNLDNLLSHLKKINYSGFLSLEVLGCEDIKESWNILIEKLT